MKKVNLLVDIIRGGLVVEEWADMAEEAVGLEDLEEGCPAAAVPPEGGKPIKSLHLRCCSSILFVHLIRIRLTHKIFRA